MVFNGVMLDEMVACQPDADVLLGRPLPAAQVADFVRRHANSPAPAARPQWLADSGERIGQYAEIARANDAPLRINLEIDVGLHRGGLQGLEALSQALDLIAGEPLLRVTGLMGYDAHAAGAASPSAVVGRGMERYAAAVGLLREKLGGVAGMTLNTAGSPTYALHLADPYANEVSIGSAFVKPTHFDLPTLAHLQPAAFVVQPVLKVMDPALPPPRGPDRRAEHAGPQQPARLLPLRRLRRCAAGLAAGAAVQPALWRPQHAGRLGQGRAGAGRLRVHAPNRERGRVPAVRRRRRLRWPGDQRMVADVPRSRVRRIFPRSGETSHRRRRATWGAFLTSTGGALCAARRFPPEGEGLGCRKRERMRLSG